MEEGTNHAAPNSKPEIGGTVEPSAEAEPKNALGACRRLHGVCKNEEGNCQHQQGNVVTIRNGFLQVCHCISAAHSGEASSHQSCDPGATKRSADKFELNPPPRELQMP